MLPPNQLVVCRAAESFAFRSIYDFADILIKLDQILLLEISDFAVTTDYYQNVMSLTADMSFWKMGISIMTSANSSTKPFKDHLKVAEIKKIVEGNGIPANLLTGQMIFLKAMKIIVGEGIKIEHFSCFVGSIF